MNQFECLCTFLHVTLQHGSVSEDECVEDGLAGGVEGPVQADVTAGRPVAAVLGVDVAMDPGDEQVQRGPHGAAGGGMRTLDENNAGTEEKAPHFGFKQPLCSPQWHQLTVQGRTWPEPGSSPGIRQPPGGGQRAERDSAESSTGDPRRPRRTPGTQSTISGLKRGLISPGAPSQRR